MRTAAESNVLAHIRAVVLELMRIVELSGVAIAGPGKQHDDRAGRDIHAANGGVGTSQPEVALDGTLGRVR
jgi:hypothetical protein